MGRTAQPGKVDVPTPREWDTRVVWVVQHQRWWWNAWRESTSTELSGFADSPEEARQDMTYAIRAYINVCSAPGRKTLRRRT